MLSNEKSILSGENVLILLFLRDFSVHFKYPKFPGIFLIFEIIVILICFFLRQMLGEIFLSSRRVSALEIFFIVKFPLNSVRISSFNSVLLVFVAPHGFRKLPILRDAD